MRRPRYFVDTPLTEGASVTLSERQGHHLVRVLRRLAEDPIELVDPQGRAWSAVIAEAKPGACRLEVRTPIERETESPLAILLAIPLMRSARLDQAVQKATELGVTEVALFTSERSEVASLSTSKLQHLAAVGRSAAEQSGRLRCPRIVAPMRIVDLLEESRADTKLLFHPGAPAARGDASVASVAAVSGPEGGFSDAELAAARAAGWQIVGLGPRTLRAETAPVAIATLLQSMWGDLR